MTMVFGTLILAIAFIDRLYQVIFFNYDELEIEWEVKDEKAIEDKVFDKTSNNQKKESY